MILIVNVCKEELHYYEFVKPIIDILKKENIDFQTFSLGNLISTQLDNNFLKRVDKVIICGTSLGDNFFMMHKMNYDWLSDFKKPVLGICAGMQIIGFLNGGKIKKKTEIGFYSEVFEKEFLGLSGKQEVYHLHNNFIDFRKLKDFEVICQGNNIPQAVKHKNKEVYGVLFHPEVRQKNVIKEFAMLK